MLDEPGHPDEWAEERREVLDGTKDLALKSLGYKALTDRQAERAFDKLIEGLQFIESKEGEEGWDFPGTAREFLAEVKEIIAEDKP